MNDAAGIFATSHKRTILQLLCPHNTHFVTRPPVQVSICPNMVPTSPSIEVGLLPVRLEAELYRKRSLILAGLVVELRMSADNQSNHETFGEKSNRTVDGLCCLAIETL